MATRVPITVRLETFEGPLDLLLYLIQSHEMQITKISVSEVTDQYLSYVTLMQELNFDVASEFLLMAATLIYWKSKSILPSEGDEATLALTEEPVLTQEELIRRLLEHRRFKKAGETLAALPRLHEDVFARLNPRTPIERIWKELNVSDLTLSYQDMLVKARKRKTILKKETVSLTDKIQTFARKLELGVPTALSKMVSDIRERPEVVVTFLASLEMSRLKKMRLHQERTYEEIYLELIDSLINFDLSLASGFEDPVPSPVIPAATPDLTQVPAEVAPIFEPASAAEAGESLS